VPLNIDIHEERSLVKIIKDPKKVEEVRLPNGLTMELWDYSRRLAGDRWLVGLLVKIPMEVAESDFESIEDGSGLFQEFLEKNGGRTILFQVQKERNFIDEREKDQVFQSIMDNLKQHSMDYMGHKAFAAGYKRRVIKEFLERRRWWNGNQ